MPLKEKTIERLYWPIGEVADELGVKASLLRYWEKEFGSLRPKRTEKGDRLYTRDDIAQLKQIQRLVKEQGYTLQGAKGRLRKEKGEEPDGLVGVTAMELRDRLLLVRARLMELRDGNKP